MSERSRRSSPRSMPRRDSWRSWPVPCAASARGWPPTTCRPWTKASTARGASCALSRKRGGAGPCSPSSCWTRICRRVTGAKRCSRRCRMRCVRPASACSPPPARSRARSRSTVGSSPAHCARARMRCVRCSARPPRLPQSMVRQPQSRRPPLHLRSSTGRSDMPVSLGSILSSARSPLASARAAIGGTSDNIATAPTPGYSRKRAELTPAHPLTMPEGQFGTGVRIADISRLRDALLDGSFRDASAEDAASRARAQALGQLESLFGEPSETGLGATLDAFYNAWSDLAGNPTNASARLVIRERGHQVAARFQQLAAGMQRLASDTEVRLRTDVDRVNDLARRIGELNVDIVAAESGGRSAGALRDERDRLIDELSTLGPIEVIPRGTSSV